MEEGRKSTVNGPAAGTKKEIIMTKTVATYWNFLWAGLLNHVQTGSVCPSQRFLIAKMIAPVPKSYRGQILELGPGTGAVTTRLAERCPGARILACEINPLFARNCRQDFASKGLSERVKVVCGSAERLLGKMAQNIAEKPDFIISGIPLGNLERRLVADLVGRIHECLAVGGLYIQFQYSLIDRETIRTRFPKLRTAPAFLNFPPAFVYYARK
jgi:phosphatidylethanolamine/phosphatidyl-N-methylethanolamine N-methyltransferase